MKFTLTAISVVVVALAAGILAVAISLGRSFDCSPGQHDGQCGLITGMGYIAGFYGAAACLVIGGILILVLLILGLWMRLRRRAQGRHLMRKRRASRVLLFDPTGAVLLVRFEIPRKTGDFVFWALPGGEIEAGESEAEGMRREILEELGLNLAVTGPIRIDTNQFEHEGEMVDNTDYFFRAACDRDAPKLLGVTAAEIRIMKEIRWWTMVELEQTGEKLFPIDLAGWVRECQAYPGG